MPDIFTSPKPPVIATPPPPAHATAPSIIDTPPTPMNLFSTLIIKPNGVTFTEQDPDEDVILFFRSDFITNVPWIFSTFILLFVPPVLNIIAPFSGISLSFLTPQLILIITLFFYLLVFSYAFINFMYWFYNVGIVTQKHVIDVNFADVTYKNIATAPMQELSDIDYKQQGFLQTFFDYGNVTIRTQGSAISIEFFKVPRPGTITDIILQLREEARGS